MYIDKNQKCFKMSVRRQNMSEKQNMNDSDVKALKRIATNKDENKTHSINAVRILLEEAKANEYAAEAISDILADDTARSEVREEIAKAKCLNLF
jgi:hypothetical protein